MKDLFTYTQASDAEVAKVKATIRNNPGIYGTAGGMLARDPTNPANFALLVYDFTKSNLAFSITQEHLSTPQGNDAFREMAAQGNLPILDFLLGKGMDVNARNARGVTALAIAITRGQVETIERLLEAGADPNLVYFDQFASLQQAVEQYLIGRDRDIASMQSNYRSIIDLLVAHGADVDQGRRLAAKAGKKDVVLFLDGLRSPATPRDPTPATIEPPRSARAPKATEKLTECPKCRMFNYAHARVCDYCGEGLGNG